ncbi:hypothetical protein ACJIZ3_019420 [Penstemon smallii]|uniref:RING-type E3 ubiquitin transferase n=1 Tax=Penstemon smallii TaxID=265156 RepID=A0ABD3T1R9_9LAMI
MKTTTTTTTTAAAATEHHGITKISLISLFLVLSQKTILVGAQSVSSGVSNPNYATFSPSMAIIIVVLIASLFFMAFFSIYIRNCSDSSSNGASLARRALSIRARRAAAARGLDASVIETFPTFSYSEVKDHKIGKGTLECAVCLNEFEDDETLRLIPKCDHVFHPECIDAWLESHVTCPVCRADLVPKPEDEPVPVQVPNSNEDNSNNNVVERNDSRRDEVIVEVEENQEPRVNRNFSLEYPNRPVRSWSVGVFGFGKFRSHSTGHSLVQPGVSMERFTLRLPENVRKEVMDRASLNRTGSCATTLPREGSSRRGYRGEGSSRGGRFRRIDPRSEREAKSDRWVLFTRGSSMKSSRTPVKMPSFNCLEPKAVDEAGLFTDDRSDKSPV